MSPEESPLTGHDLYAELLTHHEAGHVLACTEFGIRFDTVALETGFWSGRFTGGYVATKDAIRTAKIEQLDEEMIMYFAGRAAEERWMDLHPRHGVVRPEGGYHDFQVARRYMRQYETSSEAALRRKAAQLVLRRWGQIEALAAVLQDRKRLSAAAAKRAVKAS